MFSGGQLKAPETAVSTLDHRSAGRRQGFLPAVWTSGARGTERLPRLVPSTACLGMRERDTIQLKAVRELMLDEKNEHGTGNSSYGQTRGGVGWVSGNNQVREKNISLYGRNTRRKTKEKARIGMSLVLRQSHSGEL